MDIGDWLRRLGLAQYERAFRDNAIDEAVLPSLTAEDLKDLGVALVGHRRRLLDAIAALANAMPPAAAEPAKPSEAERRQLTVLFCDLAGSTELAARLDPEDLREIVAAYQARVGETIAGFGGFVAKYMGDGVLAYFGYPQAHEDDAERAARAGLALVGAVGRIASPEPLRIRIGIATGLVVVGDLLGAGAAQEQSVIGETPNLAARLQALAEPNAVVIAETTRRQIGGLFDLADLGAQPLKGFAERQRVWRVTGESGVDSRFAALRSGTTRLVGREEEIDLLSRRWAQAKSGDGRVVLLSAEPGIGKSRLAEALQERIASEPHFRLRHFCSPHHQDSALYPFIAQLERAAGFARDDAPAARLDKLGELLAGAAAGNDLAVLAELLSLPAGEPSVTRDPDPQRRKEETFGALLRQLAGLARERPALMVFEDIHWIDPTSRELLDRVIERVERLPVLLIATFRPEFQPPWSGQPHVTTLALNRLGRRESRALVEGLAGNTAALAPEILDEIVERTDGVPLFLEEVTKTVIESAPGGDAAAPHGAVAAIPGVHIAVPATLQASLLARLDRLGPTAREIAQVGAAIGREFPYDLLLAAAAKDERELRAGIDRLVAAGLLFQRGLPPRSDYQFKHALVQDTAYSTLLRGPRQALHARIATALEERFADQVARAPELLAHHLTEAGRSADAVSYWLEAGRHAAARSANVEAIAHLTRGLATLEHIDETAQRERQELALQLALGPALMSVHGHDASEAGAAYRRTRELADKLGDERARFAGVWGIWLSGGGGRVDLVDEMFRAADALNDKDLLLQAHHSAWAARTLRGDLAAADGHVREGLALYDRERHRDHAFLYGGHDPGVCGHGLGSLTAWLLGRPDEAAEKARASLALGESLDHVPSHCHALYWLGMIHQLRRDPAAARDCGKRLITLGSEHGLLMSRSFGGTLHGWAVAQEEIEEGLREMRAAADLYRAGGSPLIGCLYTIHADTELRAGHVEAAQKALARVPEAYRENFWRAEMLRLEGDLLLARGAEDEAEGRYRKAIELARRQGARSLELRAAMAFARLRRRQGRPEEGRALLAPVYAAFSEGLDTPDLVDARHLLEE